MLNLDKTGKVAGRAGDVDDRCYANWCRPPGRSDRVRELRHLDWDQTRGFGATRPEVALRVSTSDLAPAAISSASCQAVDARRTDRSLMTGTLVPVCDRYTLPGSHYPCIPLAR
jgi:hypothetical protein